VPEDRKGSYRDEVERYKKEKAEIKAAAEKLEAESTAWDKRSDEQLAPAPPLGPGHHGAADSIALAAIALLTRRKWLEWGMFGVAAIGVALGVAAFLHV
jgi:hypothetical protein